MLHCFEPILCLLIYQSIYASFKKCQCHFIKYFPFYDTIVFEKPLFIIIQWRNCDFAHKNKDDAVINELA